MARTTRRRKLKVLFAASEVVPFSKTGGLGDVAGSLPSALKHVGAKVAVISPLYKTISSTWKDKMTKVGERRSNSYLCAYVFERTGQRTGDITESACF